MGAQPRRDDHGDQRGQVHVRSPQQTEQIEHAGRSDVDWLGAVDRGTLWGRLRLTQSQVARLTGVSPRQISRWAAKGLLIPSPGRAERYNGNAVEQVILMQRAIARGHPPAEAARLAVLVLAGQVDHGAFPIPAPADVYEKLAAGQQALAAVVEILFPNGAPE